MEIRIRISLDNAAFADNPDELAEVLRQIPSPLDADAGYSCSLFDSNGNTVGRWVVCDAATE